MAETPLILSLFPGIDLLGRAFEANGFCVVRGPDVITGGDIRDFAPPTGCFDGIIGGPPCQDFSRLNRNPGTYSHEMTSEFCRVVQTSAVDWFLYENVVTAPSFQVEGYQQQCFAIDLAWFSPYSRRRNIVFGSKHGKMLNPIIRTKAEIAGTCITGSDERSFAACCEIQGLPADFDLPFFSLAGKKQAIANGVPMQLGSYIAGLISSTIYGRGTPKQTYNQRLCNCGCGRPVAGKARYAHASCRKRAQRARNADMRQISTNIVANNSRTHNNYMP